MAQRQISVSEVIDKSVLKIDTKEEAAELIQAVEECDGLECLDLSGKSFGVGASVALAEVLKLKKSLKKAHWSDMFVSKLKNEIPLALKALGEALIESGAQLEELDLSDNAFGPNGVEGLVDLLKSGPCYSLKVVKFQNNGLGIAGSKLLSKAFLETCTEAERDGLKFAPEVFIAGRNRLENEGAEAVGKVFKTVQSLKVVRMIQNGINFEGISHLADAFLLNKELEEIDLSDNTFTERGASVMSETIRQLEHLRVINFNDCLVRNDGAKSLAISLEEGHDSLEEIHLTNNEIELDGAMAILNAVAKKPNIKKIDLNGNCFGEEGSQQIIDFMEGNGLNDILGELDEDEGLLSDEDEDGDDNEGGSTESENEEGRGLLQVKEMRQPPDEVDKKSEDGRSSESFEELGQDLKTTEEFVQLFLSITLPYKDGLDQKSRNVIESKVDGLLRNFTSQHSFLSFINEFLVQVGILKSEDKKFRPETDIEGPLLALCCHVCKQQYVKKNHIDILIAFLTKPSKPLEPLKTIQHKLLQALHTL